MFKLILAGLVSLAGVQSQELKAGLKTSLDISILDQAKDVWFDQLLTVINNIQLPDLDDGHGSYLKGNKLTILERTSKVDFYPDVANNAVVFSNKKISAIATCEKFRYKIAPLIFADGSAEVDINTIEIDAGLSFSTTVLPSGHVVPYVTGADVYTHINRFDIVIKLQGNYITEIGEIA
jgi:hypothetical protein